MIESQYFIVEVNGHTIRFPYPHPNQVQHIETDDDLNTKKLHFFYHDSQHDHDFQRQEIQQIKQDIPWFVIGSVRIVFIMLQFLDE